ncbi:exonuclease domain-containing protein [Psychromonas sp. SR45-3]|uniref:exonuclease domain-containing protein n=1 Tax=Psychromonas sp. SR45-3 TaxID=2760930 RepID=UPI0015F9817F|nr:exonuclease domain-containing protein [Psychromonas sp. SR45-3]MBB1273442.1 3'-5' exonuclease [Psychromonas sp. SR45-3]
MFQRWWLQYQLKRLIKNNKLNALQDHYQYLLSQLDSPISDIKLLALDIEMTGLDSKKDQMVSIGVIPIINAKIQPKLAQYKLIKIQGTVGQSAVIHGVLDRHLDNALPLQEVLQWLFEQCQDKVIVAHYASLDLQFLQQSLVGAAKQSFALFAIDTLLIDKKRELRKHQSLNTSSLRLNACRERYNLPIYNAHNALTDALACAELLLAQLSKMGGIDKVTLQQLLNRH